MRRPAPALAILLLAAACAPERTGPAAPIAAEQLTAATALDASAARQSVVEFVHAYTVSPTQGAGALADVIAGRELASWVRWLDVQHREFAGSIEAEEDLRDVEFVAFVETPQASGAQVLLSASVTFRFAPEGADAFERTRILDGLATVIRTEAGAYRVVDLHRDGVPISQGIQLFPDESRTRRGVSVVLDSLYMFPPNWQFNVTVRNLGDRPLSLEPEATALFAGLERVDGLNTGSLVTIPPGGEADGILAFPMQDSAESRVLALAYRSGRSLVRFEFPLDDLVTSVPAPPTAEAEGPDGSG